MDFYLFAALIVLIALSGFVYAGFIARNFHRRVMSYQHIPNKTVATTIFRVWFFSLVSTIVLLVLVIVPSPGGTGILTFPDDWLLMLLCILVFSIMVISALGPTLIILYFIRKEGRNI